MGGHGRHYFAIFEVWLIGGEHESKRQFHSRKGQGTQVRLISMLYSN